MQHEDMQKNEQLLLTFYGDDFTGSTDALESLTINGLPTVLFLDVPTPDMLERFPDMKCVGVAGNSRAKSPQEMEQELPAIFTRLRELNSRYVHYKVCSTFDSSKNIGNIGTVINLSKSIFRNQSWVPILVASPDLKRYTVFGNHFAGYGERTYRLDRHPTMSRHPITPMVESDLRLVLQDQGLDHIALFDVNDLEQEPADLVDSFKSKISNDAEAVVFDALRKEHVEKTGEILESIRQKTEPMFVVGSSGVGHAVSSNDDSSKPVAKGSPSKTEQLLVISGSCSPVTQQQLQWAFDHGFEGIRLSLPEIMDSEDPEGAIQSLVTRAREIVKQGKNLVIYTALGPDDPSIKESQQQMISSGSPISDSSKLLGSYLGDVAKKIIQQTGLERLVIAGGDTSSYATSQLGIYAMEMIASISPGAPLCRCYSDDPEVDGLELALKSGQFGGEDYFAKVQGI